MPTERIEFSQILGNGILHGAEALETVVQVGQVDQGECRIVGPIHSLCSLCDPRARTNRGIGTPEAEEGEWAQLFLEREAKVCRPGGDIRDLPTVRGIQRARGYL